MQFCHQTSSFWCHITILFSILHSSKAKWTKGGWEAFLSHFICWHSQKPYKIRLDYLLWSRFFNFRQKSQDLLYLDINLSLFFIITVQYSDGLLHFKQIAWCPTVWRQFWPACARLCNAERPLWGMQINEERGWVAVALATGFSISVPLSSTPWSPTKLSQGPTWKQNPGLNSYHTHEMGMQTLFFFVFTVSKTQSSRGKYIKPFKCKPVHAWG